MPEIIQLFKLDDGDRFEWQGENYTVVNVNGSDISDDDTIIVRRDTGHDDERFNPYCMVKKI